MPKYGSNEITMTQYNLHSGICTVCTVQCDNV